MTVAVDSLAMMAARYLQAGLSVIPIRADGSKAPLVRWTTYQGRLPTTTEIARWFAKNVGIAIICGKVSGNLEVIDFDDPAYFPAWVFAVESEAPGLLDRLPQVETPTGGMHVYYRCPQIEGNQPLATAADGKKAIETRGEGGYVLAPGGNPAAHPSGKPYVLRSGSLTRSADWSITALERTLLLAAARSLSQTVPENNTPQDANGRPLAGLSAREGERPGDEFNSRATWAEVLGTHGWRLVRGTEEQGQWCRPGKPQGVSATAGWCKGKSGNGLLYVFSTNATPLEAGKSYSKFAAYAILAHGGDYRAAAAALAATGYGSPAPVAGGLKGSYRSDGAPPPAKLAALQLANPLFAKVWTKYKRDKEMMLSLATFALRDDWSDQEVLDLLALSCAVHPGDPVAADEVCALVRHAKKFASSQSERKIFEAYKINAGADDGEQRLKHIGKLLGGIDLADVIKRGKSNCEYSLVLMDGSEIVVGKNVFVQATVRLQVMNGTKHLGVVRVPHYKQHEWSEVAWLIGEAAREEELPGADDHEQVEDALNHYLGLAAIYEGSEWSQAAMQGEPFLQDGRIYFGIMSLHRWMEAQRCEVRVPNLRAILRRLGYVPEQRSFRASGQVHTRRLWSTEQPPK